MQTVLGTAADMEERVKKYVEIIWDKGNNYNDSILLILDVSVQFVSLECAVSVLDGYCYINGGSCRCLLCSPQTYHLGVG